VEGGRARWAAALGGGLKPLPRHPAGGAWCRCSGYAIPACPHVPPVPSSILPCLQRAAAPKKAGTTKTGTTKKAASTGTAKKSVLGSVFGSRG